MYTDESREYILKELLENIWGFSDKDYQRRVWIRGEGPECDDYTESYCYFDDIGNLIIKNGKDFHLTDEQIDSLIRFKKELLGFASPSDAPQTFIDTPEWKKVVDEAKTVLQAFNYQN